MKLNIIILFVFSLTIAKLQPILNTQSYSGYILDKETNESLPYVNIGVINKGIGTVTDENGKFSFEDLKFEKKDSLAISCLGYKKTTFLVEEFLKKIKKDNKIYLEPESILLDPIVITNKEFKDKVLGNKTEAKKGSAGFRNAKAGNELGLKIKVRNRVTKIKKFKTYVISNSYQDTKFRLNFYSVKDNMPFEKIFFKNIIFTIDKKEGLFELDLSNFNIIMEQDFIVTLEILEYNSKDNKELAFSASLFSKPIIYRYTSQDKWQKKGTVGIGFNLEVEQEK